MDSQERNLNTMKKLEKVEQNLLTYCKYLEEQ